MGVSARQIRTWIAVAALAVWPALATAQHAEAPAQAPAAAGHVEAVPGHAAEAPGEHGGEQSLFAGDFGNVFWTLLIFVGLLVVLGKYAWRPMLDALSRREQFIRQTLETAQKERTEAERMMAEYRELIVRSKQEAQAIVDQGRHDAETARQRLHQQAQTESEQLIGRARQEIQLAKQSALQDLQNLAADLSVNVASKIIQRNLSTADQKRLVEESLKQLAESGNGKAGT